MRKRTKWILGSVVCLAVLGVIGYNWVISFASDRLVEQVTKDMLTDDEVNELMKEPAVQKALEEQLGAIPSDQEEVDQDSAGDSQKSDQNTTVTPEPSESGGRAGSSSSGSETGTSTATTGNQEKVGFSNKEEALKFLLSRFSMSELKEFVSMASGGVTAEEKQEIKKALLERLSPEEFQALKVLGLIELKKRQQELP
ncbi:hypothetical protein [Ammoniphilus resinae]|uniref:Uncharacterized protein n=1 Tax=Ammoniphilus resinae TaxID=861532 RepID=A0ABS4GUZ9_9BACL|nr:hypothetical protein [Ammoniphilus resinae]MBP1934079.1 hypothetical protein [Ammoniphilus resinae]